MVSSIRESPYANQKGVKMITTIGLLLFSPVLGFYMFLGMPLYLIKKMDKWFPFFELNVIGKTLFILISIVISSPTIVMLLKLSYYLSQSVSRILS